MLLIICGWVVILMRPVWNFLFFFSGCMAAWWAFNAVLLAIELSAELSPWITLLNQMIGIAIHVVFFLAGGALIVSLRGGKSEPRGPSEAEIDDELARFRQQSASASVKAPLPAQPHSAPKSPPREEPDSGQWTLPP